MSQKCRRVRGTFALQGSTVDRWWRLDCHVRPADPEDGTKAIPPKADDAEAKRAAAAATPAEANALATPVPVTDTATGPTMATPEPVAVDAADTATGPTIATPAEPDAAVAAAIATPAEPDAGIAATIATPAESDETVAEDAGAAPRRRRWPWVSLLLLLLAASLGMALGVGVVLRGRSFGAQLPADQAARPTFVVAAPPSPSPSGSPRAASTPGTAAATTSSDEYTVEAGDTLRSIAQQVYGDPAQWPRIYDANRETIGPDPDTLSAGTRLRLPRP
jgi:nucleoid-associated protein YgaU